MSASSRPVFSPSAAKPSARLQEVVDLPTPPLPEATAMTCLTPGMPEAFDVARALRSGGVADIGCSRSKRIVLLDVARAQIIFRRHDRRALRPRMRIETLVHNRLDAAIRAHLDDVEASGIGALEHPVPLAAELRQHAINRTPGAERFAAGDAVERLFLLQHALRRVPGLEVEARLDSNDFFGAGGFAEPALHAKALGEAQHRAIGIVRQRARRAGGDAGVAQRAALDIQFHAAEGGARRQWHDIDRRG